MKKPIIIRGLLILIASIMIIMCIFPFYWAVVSSLKKPFEMVAYPPVFIPSTFNVFYYLRLFLKRGFAIYGINSIIVVLSTTFLSVAIGSLAGYSLAKLPFPKTIRGVVATAILTVYLLPHVVLAIPLFSWFRRLGLFDTKFGLVLTYSVIYVPLVVWICRGYMENIPGTIEDAATVDGCSRFGVFLRIVLPMSTTALVTAAIITFIFSWNEFAIALFLTATKNSQTLPIGVYGLRSHQTFIWQVMSAGGVLTSIPAILFSIFATRYLIKGLTFQLEK